MKKQDKKKINIISLGAGVQSTTVLLMAMNGALGDIPEHAIFADTQYEPKAVYDHFEWLRKASTIPIHTVTSGNIRKDALDKKKHRFASMPLFVKNKEGKTAMLRRQCTHEYKIVPIRRKIRELIDDQIRKVKVVQWIGISLDEATRMRDSNVKYIDNYYPLIEKRMTRLDCLNWLERNGYPKPPKSSCICCPFHDNHFWKDMKKNAPIEFEDAVDFDKKIRKSLQRFTLKSEAYLHRSIRPLDEVEFDGIKGQINMFENECEGVCGV